MAIALAITSVGLVSSVGGGAAEACAAIRAGISRVRPVPHLSTLDPDAQAPEALQGHPIHGLTDGFAPSARWRIMAGRALVDLMAGRGAGEGARGGEGSRAGVIFVLPVLDDARFFYAPLARPDAIWASCLDPVLEDARLTVPPAHRALLPLGAGGIAAAFEMAGTWLEGREVDRVLVVAVDSLLDAWSLLWLSGAGRIKDADNPVGLAPGEAAVALLLERRGNGPALARTAAAVFEEIDEPFQNPERRHGRGLVTALRRALGGAGGRLDGDIYVNLNGEEWRAAELGTALSSLPAATRGPQRLIAPATSVGDVGAAAGALQIACALRSFARGYAAAPHAWILATSDDGDVSALCLEAA